MSLIPFGFWGGVNEIIFSTGLKGARFNGYFADDVNWFATATPHGDIDNNRTQLNVFSSNDDFYSWIWYGYFLAPISGSYTFYTASDDASYLWLGSNALNPTTGNALVNNGGLHGVQEVAGSITLTKDTYYAMLIMFGESTGGDEITVSFQGPGISKTTNGLGYYFGGQESYGGNWIAGVVPRFDEEEFIGGGSIVTDQLICNLDARNTSSYPGTGTTWFDLTGNSSASITGNFALSFNSTGKYFELLQATSYFADLRLVSIDSTTPTLTVELWTKPYDTGAAAGMFFGFGLYDLYRSSQGVGFNTAVGDLYGMTTGQLTNSKFYGEWHHIVCVMQQTTSYTNNKIYLDGTLIYNLSQVLGNEDPNSRTFYDGFMRINGWYINDSNPYRQDISIFRVYKKELSQAEVLQNYNADRTYSTFNKPANKNIIPDGLRFYTDMEGELEWFGSSGSYVRDYSGYNFFGTLYGGAAWASEFGGYMPLRNANNRYIDINRGATSGGFGLSYGSASFVMMVRCIDQAFQEFVFGRPDVAPSFGEDVNIRFNGQSIRYAHNDSNIVDTFPTGSLASNVWYHVVMTYNYDTYVVQIYINGILVVPNGFQERMIGISANSYALGRVNNLTYTYDLGLFMIYNRVISGSEVTTLYNTQKNRFGIVNNGIVRNPIQFYWDFNNSFCYSGTGTTLNGMINETYDGEVNKVTSFQTSVDGGGGRFVLVKENGDFISSINTNFGPATINTSDFSAEIWCKLANLNQQGIILGQRNSTTGDRFTLHVGTVLFGGSFTDSRKLSLVVYKNSVGYAREFVTVDDIVPNPNTNGGLSNWLHIVATRVGSTFEIYVNGVSQSLTTVRSVSSGTPDLTSGDVWRLGNSSGTSNVSESVGMDVGIIRLYNNRLSQAEVLQNYNEEKARFGL